VVIIVFAAVSEFIELVSVVAVVSVLVFFSPLPPPQEFRKNNADAQKSVQVNRRSFIVLVFNYEIKCTE
jgi:hypothetical protein